MSEAIESSKAAIKEMIDHEIEKIKRETGEDVLYVIYSLDALNEPTVKIEMSKNYSLCCGVEMGNYPENDLCPQCHDHTGVEKANG